MDANEPAYPIITPDMPVVGSGGLTKRELIAAKMLQGFCANPAVFARNESSGWGLVNCTDEDLVGYSAHLADALITELSKQ